MKTAPIKNCDNYINALETIYSFLLVVAMTALFNYVSLSPFYIIFLLNCFLLLVRFFFAPSKNIKHVISEISKAKSLSNEQKRSYYRVALIFDVGIMLFAHALLIYLIFLYGGYWSSGVKGFLKLIDAPRADYALYAFIWSDALLLINSIWLLSINYRCKKINGALEESHSKWAFNNLRFFAIISALLLLYFFCPIFLEKVKASIGIDVFFLILTFLVIKNSLIDLYKNAETYLFNKR